MSEERCFFLQSSQEEELLLVILLYQAGTVDHPGEVLRDVDPQEFKAAHSLHCHFVDVDGWVGDSIPPEIHDELSCF